MAYIYLITNDINNKKYVGKTEFNDIQKRFSEHCKDCNRREYEKRPLYSAMKLYGVEHFYIQELEYVPYNQNLSEREIYWIDYYDTYHNGYNATRGGDGKRYLDYDLIINTYKKVQSIKETAEITGAHPDSVSNILKAANIEIKPSRKIQREKFGKSVGMYDLQDNFLRQFETLHDASIYMVENKLTGCKESTIRTHISEVCRGKRQTAAKFKWKFI